MSPLMPLPFGVLMTPPGDSSSSSKDPWVQSIKDDLKQAAEERDSGPRPVCKMFTVDPNLRKVKPKHYSPQEISLGLFHRSPLTAPKTRADKCRVGMALKFLEVVGMKDAENDWEKLYEQVVPNPKETQDLYEVIGRDPLSLKEVQSVLTLDAIFLACYFGYRCCQRSRDAGAGRYYHALDAVGTEMYFAPFKHNMAPLGQNTRATIMEDILKVENQVPLHLIESALLILFPPAQHDLAHNVLHSICFYVAWFLEVRVPGFNKVLSTKSVASYNFSASDTLLDCGYRWLLRNKVNKPRPENWKELESSHWHTALPSVTQLQEAGIEFRGREGGYHGISFQRGFFKAVLYLPTLMMYDNIGAIWRNLLVFEEMQRHARLRDSNQSSDFCCYIIFMDQLIDDEKDVRLLTKGRHPVIKYNALGSNEALAQMFNNELSQNCVLFHNYNWILLEKEIHDYYDQGLRRMWVEFKRTNLGKPWIIISLVGAIIVVVATVLQTIYTMLGYYHSD